MGETLHGYDNDISNLSGCDCTCSGFLCWHVAQ
ncbi:SWIM zinc finger family protein [Psychromonas arctica]